MSKLCLIGIVTYNGEQYIQKCIDSLLQHASNCDIIVVDNCSTDGTISIVENYKNQIDLKLLEKNLGFGQANNHILKHAIKHDYKYIYLVNQDTYLIDESTKDLIQYANENPGLHIYSPLHLSADHKSLDKSFELYINPESKDFLKNDSDIITTTFINAAAWLIPTKILIDLGGFNPVFFHYGEDRDLANRLKSKAGNFQVITSSKIVHNRIPINMKELDEINTEKYLSRYLLLFKTFATSLNHNLAIGYFQIIKSSIHLIFKNLIGLKPKIAWGVLLNLFHCLTQLFSFRQNRKNARKKYAFLNI